MDCSLPESSVHVILQGRILRKWSGCHFLLQGIFLTQETNLGLLHCRHILYWLHYEGKPNILNNSHLRSVVGSQETPGVTGKFGLGIWNEAGQRQIEFCQENALVIANTLFQQHKRRLYTWTSPDGQHRNQIDYILCSQRRRSSIQSTKTRPGADCGSDHELLIAKYRLKLKKVGKTTRSFRCDLNKIPYNYTVKVRDRFKGLDLIDRVPDELWMDVHDIVQETVIRTIPKIKKCKKAKWLSEKGLQIGIKRREAKGK